jgi:hypothetical protein
LIDRTRKLKHYARVKVGWIWLVDPVMRTVEVLQLQGDDWMLAATSGGDEKARLAPFDAVEIDLAILWLTPPPPGSRAQEPSPGEELPPRGP